VKVGDLVKYVGDNADDPPILRAGLVTGFDKDGDPIVLFHGDADPEGPDGSTFYTATVEVINECW
jgi:hypothetical protein